MRTVINRNNLHPEFIRDKSMVMLPVKEYDMLLSSIEEMEDILLYDEAKKKDNGEYVLLSDYIKKRNV